MQCVDYVPAYERELVEVWRAAFERALDLEDPHPIEDQIAYLRANVLPDYRVRVALEQERIIGFLAANEAEISQLYIHVDHQRRGVGSALLDLAKADSRGRLTLYTFERNRGARAFYEQHGFRIIQRGFEPHWQLSDLQYEWIR